MPRDRLRSPRAGHGRKIEALTDFEFRVWDQFQLSADCFGVLRFNPHKLKEDNKRLAKALDGEILAALERIADIGLVKKFEHQDEVFLCDPTWQDFQKIDYPYATLLPKPPSSTLLYCTPLTRKLFRKHPGGSAGRSLKDHRRITEGSTASRITANGIQPSANSKRQTADAKFEQFWAPYPLKVSKPKARAAFAKVNPDDALLTLILAGLERHKASRQWQKDDGEYIPHASTFLNQRRWEDQPAPAVGRLAVKVDPVQPDVRQLCESAGLNQHDIGTWFKGARLIGRRLVVIEADIRQWIERHYMAKLRAVTDGLELVTEAA